jgi:cobalt-precorrin-5B (C1)-methyltransferase
VARSPNRNPSARGPAKMTNLEGMLGLHSKRHAVDLAALAARANSSLHAFELAEAAGFDLPALVANGAWAAAARCAPSELEIVVVGRDGRVLASSGFRRV